MAGQKRLNDAAIASNPSALGDPVSLKAEQSDTSPTEQEKGAQSQALQSHQQEKTDKKSLKECAEQDLNEAKKGNRSLLGDPVSLKAEKSENDPARDADENEDGTGRSGVRKGRGRYSKL
ncbi:hypothetical protein CLAIMM_13917 [Cladophialophora immunda]|nr:hypothetical protein CLAIMM_13917 [Cladophialophora immunda]